MNGPDGFIIEQTGPSRDLCADPFCAGGYGDHALGAVADVGEQAGMIVSVQGLAGVGIVSETGKSGGHRLRLVDWPGNRKVVGGGAAHACAAFNQT